MAHDHPNVESALMKNLGAPGNAFALSLLFIIFQYSFKLDFQCPCNAFNNTSFCSLYVFLPFCGLWFILTSTTKTCEILCAQLCSRSRPQCSWGCCSRITCTQIVRNSVLSALWIVTVLIDGDALVCWRLTEGNVTHWHDQIPCKEKEKLTAEESLKIRYNQALSQVIGLIVLFGIPVFWFVLSMIYQSCETPSKSLFKDVWEEEAMSCVEMEMQNMIRTKTKEDCMRELSEIRKDNVNWKEVSKKLIELITKENPWAEQDNNSSTLSSSAKSESSSAKPESSSTKRRCVIL